MAFPFYKQQDAMDCGPSCLRMISKFYGKHYSLRKLRQEAGIGKDGVSLLGISEAAESIGFRSKATRISMEKISAEKPIPCILHWEQRHFVVLYKIRRNSFYISDPAKGKVIYNRREFAKSWCYMNTPDSKMGIGLFLEPTTTFFKNQEETEQRVSMKLLYNYLFGYRTLLLQLLFGLLAGSILQLILPFLTQSIVDIGISSRSLNFISLVLIGQLFLMAGQTIVGFIRNWITLHIGTRVNLSILSDFVIKIMKLPPTFFESRLTGDILQRIGDHKRIENFLTGSTLNILLSVFNIVALSVLLIFYDTRIFLIFLSASALYIGWITLFLKKRRELDGRNFHLASRSHNQVIQLIRGMLDIKLSGSERFKRWEWEDTQAGLFRLEIKGLSLSQYQESGAFLINQVKNVFIIFLSARAVMNGQMSFGAMLAIQIIIGELNGPIQQLVILILAIQDAKISLERLNDVYSMDDESKAETHRFDSLPTAKDLYLDNVSFCYPGAGNLPVFSDLNIIIPSGKKTAIVGSSGSGKTTLLKLLLNFYQATQGEIKVGDIRLDNIKQKLWRSKCGAVLQDGFIFSDTIAGNIAVGEERIDMERLREAIRISNLEQFIDTLPLGLHTKIGDEGNGLSQGQRQRILIARAVYKDPDYILFDEATNSLDANNEAQIVRNLETFFEGRTVVIVAHRLSTIRDADQIIVLEKGKVAEIGNHHELLSRQGIYYELVKRQLEKIA